MTSFYQSLTVNTEVSHVVYVRAEGAYLRNFSEIKKVRGNLFFHGLSYYIVIENLCLETLQVFGLEVLDVCGMTEDFFLCHADIYVGTLRKQLG